MNAWAVIVAGGRGLRMGANVPKQFLTINGHTIYERTMSQFIACPDISGIVVAVPQDVLELVYQVEHGDKEFTVVPGGSDRQESVWNALCAVPESVEIVAVHDAVRPFVTTDLITRCIKGASEHGAVSVMRPVTETIKAVSNGVVVSTPDRSTLWSTQTPQAFTRSILVDAHLHAQDEGFTGTDDCMLVERLDHRVHVIEGSDMNIKITTPVDLEIAQIISRIFDTENPPC